MRPPRRQRRPRRKPPSWLRHAAPAAAPGPQPDSAAEAIQRIDRLSATAKASWFGMLSYLAFVGVTLMGVEDADFFLIERQTELPLIGVSIPTFLFFWIAPRLATALYAYFHLHLQKLWDALARPPETVGDLPLSDAISPWLINDFALRFRGAALARRNMQWVATGVTWTLAYMAAPLVIAAFWLRATPAHEPQLTLLAGALPLCLTIYVGRSSWAALQSAMRGRPTPPWIRAACASLGVLTFASIFAVGWFRTGEPLTKYLQIAQQAWETRRAAIAHYPVPPSDRRLAEIGWAQDFHPFGSARQHSPLSLARAQLAGVDFVNAPPGFRDYDTARDIFRRQWCRDRGIPSAACGPADPFADQTPEAEAILAQARQTWCRTHLPNGETGDPASEQTCAKHFADLERRFFVLRPGFFFNTRGGAWVTERDVQLAQLTSRDLTGRDFRRADLSGAQMEGADLSLAQMEGANLGGAQLGPLTSFAPASLRGAGAKEVDFTVLSSISPDFRERIAEAFGDASVRLPDGLTAGAPPLEHWPNSKLEYYTFIDEWRAWRADPEGYVPPQRRGAGAE